MWWSSRLIGGRRDRARSRRARAPRVEALEGRLVLDAGGLPVLAQNLGAVAGQVTLIDSVSAVDTDWYKLTMNLPGDLHIRLTGLTGDAMLGEFWDANGDQTQDNGESLGFVDHPGTQDEVLNLPGLAKGTHYIEVKWQGGNTANYTLQVATDFAGSTLGTARNLGSIAGLGGVVHDFVDDTDWSDFYKATMPRAGDLTVLLSGMTADADFNVFDGTGNLLISAVKVGSADDSVHLTGLAKGTYYIQVFAAQNEFDVATNYNLQVETDTAGRTFATALDLGDLTGKTKSVAEFVGTFAGTGDVADVYKFTLASKRTFKALLSGLASNVDMFLVDASGATFGHSYNAGTANDSIKTTLAPGTYYLVVFASSGGSNYNLALTG